MITGMISGAYHHRATSTHPISWMPTSTHPISWMRGCPVLEIASPDIGSPVPGDKVVVLTADEFAEVQMLARLARGSSWPGEIAECVERAARKFLEVE